MLQHLHREDLAFLSHRGSAIRADGRNQPPLLWANGLRITEKQARTQLCAQSFRLGAFEDRLAATHVEGHLQSLWMHLKVCLVFFLTAECRRLENSACGENKS